MGGRDAERGWVCWSFGGRDVWWPAGLGACLSGAVGQSAVCRPLGGRFAERGRACWPSNGRFGCSFTSLAACSSGSGAGCPSAASAACLSGCDGACRPFGGQIGWVGVSWPLSGRLAGWGWVCRPLSGRFAARAGCPFGPAEASELVAAVAWLVSWAGVCRPLSGRRVGLGWVCRPLGGRLVGGRWSPVGVGIRCPCGWRPWWCPVGVLSTFRRPTACGLGPRSVPRDATAWSC